MSVYIVYDGRARVDEDNATILECIGDMSRRGAIEEFRREWADCDAVLFEYDENEDVLTNGRIIDV